MLFMNSGKLCQNKRYKTKNLPADCYNTISREIFCCYLSIDR